MRLLKNVKELMDFIYSNDVALIAVTNDRDDYKILLEVFQRIEERSKGMIITGITFIENNDEKAVTILLYFKGQELMRQERIFGNLKKDYEALKWSVSEVLSSKGIKLPF